MREKSNSTSASSATLSATSGGQPGSTTRPKRRSTVLDGLPGETLNRRAVLPLVEVPGGRQAPARWRRGAGCDDRSSSSGDRSRKSKAGQCPSGQFVLRTSLAALEIIYCPLM